MGTRFAATLPESPAQSGWRYVHLPGSAECSGLRGLVEVRGTVDGVPLRRSSMALGDSTHEFPVAQLRVVGAAAGAMVVASAIYYAAFGSRLARHHEAYATVERPPPWVLSVELARSATVATALIVLTERIGSEGLADAARLAVGLWAAFPVVLLSGSVVHEKVPWQVAAIHGGDWLIKLLLASLIAGRQPNCSSTQLLRQSHLRLFSNR